MCKKLILLIAIGSLLGLNTLAEVAPAEQAAQTEHIAPIDQAAKAGQVMEAAHTTPIGRATTMEQAAETNTPRTAEPEKEPWITIFVHGTLGLRNTVSLRTLPTLFKENINGTRYKKKMTELRNDPAAYCKQAVQELGLKRIATDQEPVTAVQLFAEIYDTVQKECYPDQTTIAYYTFGWSGLINSTERFYDADKFLEQLQAEINTIHETYPDIKVRIVAYSHGANVALNLAEVNAQNSTPANFRINELIMIGTPVQRETDCFVADSFFANAYNIYSRSDYVAIMDCFSSIRFFSSRRFCDNARCSMGKRLKQIEIKIAVDASNDMKQPHNSKHKIDRSPGHIELWNFGWPGSSKLYREYFPFNPLPVALFAPAIVKTVHGEFPHTRNTVMSIYPDRGTSTIRQRHANKKVQAPFIDPGLIDQLKEKVKAFYVEFIKPCQKPKNVEL